MEWGGVDMPRTKPGREIGCWSRAQMAMIRCKSLNISSTRVWLFSQFHENFVLFTRIEIRAETVSVGVLRMFCTMAYYLCSLSGSLILAYRKASFTFRCWTSHSYLFIVSGFWLRPKKYTPLFVSLIAHNINMSPTSCVRNGLDCARDWLILLRVFSFLSLSSSSIADTMNEKAANLTTCWVTVRVLSSSRIMHFESVAALSLLTP